jgi:hypothetical protein
MNTLTIETAPGWAGYQGGFDLSDQQVDKLLSHQTQLTHLALGWLDEKYRLLPSLDANWPMLGQHLIELLRQSDPTAFSSICQEMVYSMLHGEYPDNPFVVASMAEAGLTDNQLFDTVLKSLLQKQKNNPLGLIPFATGFLNLGDPFSTLWALRLLILSRRVKEYEGAICKAVAGLEKSFEMLAEHADHLGFLLYDLSLLGREEDKSLVDRCLEHLLQTDPGWSELPVKNLRTGGFVAYDLLSVSGIRPQAMKPAEAWLAAAFELTDAQPKGPPAPFVDTRMADANQPMPVDVWCQGWLRAMVAATLYLRIRRPEYTPVSRLLSQSVLTANQAHTLQGQFDSAGPFLPAIAEMESVKPALHKFWKQGPFDKSVFIMRWMGNQQPGGDTNMAIQAIMDAICGELKAAGLVGRYVGDHADYSPELYHNNEIYMRGCKYGIAVFERIPRGAGNVIPSGPNHNVLVEIGFMRGKGSRVLMLYDETTMNAGTQNGVQIPEGVGLPAILDGAIREPFHSATATGINQLGQAVREFAKWITENEQEI